MRFVAIADTHGLHRNLKLPPGDAIIHAGDFCHFGNRKHLEDFLLWYSTLDYDYKLFNGGNHDFYAAQFDHEFRKLIPEEVCYLNDSGISVQGINLWGSPVAPGLSGMGFGKEEGAGIKLHWDLIPNDTDILITHTPPKGILDRASSGTARGCQVLSRRLLDLSLKAHIFGHVHASYGQVQRPSCLFINASNMDSAKGLVNPPVVFEI